MCLTYMNCMTFDNKQFTDLKKKLVFVVQKYIKHVVVLHYKSIWLNHCPSGCPSNSTPTSTNIHSRFQSGRQHLFSKLQLFYLSIQMNDGFFLRCQDTISVPKIRGMQFRTLHVLPLYSIYIIETYTLDLHAFVMQNILLHML